MLKRAVCGLLLIVLAPALMAEVSNDEWKEANSKYKSLWKKGDQVDAVKAIALDDLRAAKELWKVMTKYRPEGAVREEIATALGAMTDEKCIDFLAKTVTNKRLKPAERLTLCQALAKIKNDKVTDSLIKLAEDKDPIVQTAAVDALGVIGNKKATPVVIKALDSDAWQARVAATQALVRLMDKRGVPALIERMKKEEGNGRVEGDIIKALKAMTGEHKETAFEWDAWWKHKGSKGELAGGGMESWRDRQATGAKSGEKGDGSVPTYYGIKIYSQRVIFVIDTSDSMRKPWEGARPDKPETVTITGQKDGKKNKARKATLDWTKIKTKWDLAREHLIFTLRQLPPEAEFTIVFYSKKVSVWKPELVKASSGNVNAAIAVLKKKQPHSSTNIHGAMKKAFQIGGADGKEGNDKPVAITGGGAYKKGGDTVFFLTDGWPTSGKIFWKRPGAPDKTANPNWLEEMMADFKKWNSLRKLKVHCIGIGNHCKDLMNAISEEFGGDYVIPGEENDDD